MRLFTLFLTALALTLSGCDALNEFFTSATESEANDAMNAEHPADADVTFVRAVQNDATTWTFHVTVRHPDTGWEDYADGWDVLYQGAVIKPNPNDAFTRVLLHPHENEQPFTRSQRITLPAEAQAVRVRAHDIVHGFGGQEVVVDLTQSAGENFNVERSS